MVKLFTVDWLAQSHHNPTPKEDYGAVDGLAAQRPHVPCMVQPRQPTSYNKDYLQPKPKAPKPTERMDSAEHSGHSSPVRLANCSSPISEISGYSSGYESEAASSECLSVDEGSEGERDGAQRRVRTKFTPEQIHKLEKIFNKHKYLEAGERVKTAHKLNLSETQVRTWFQNRRMKLKREVQDLRTEYLGPMMFHHMPTVQYHGFAGQLHQYPPANQAVYMVPQVPQTMVPQIPHIPQVPQTMVPQIPHIPQVPQTMVPQIPQVPQVQQTMVPQVAMRQQRVPHHPAYLTMNNPRFY
ncbi:homeobox protein vent1-like [Polymixia lowei]